MNTSHKSRTQYLPRFPRIQRLLNRRKEDRQREFEQNVWLDSQIRVPVHAPAKYKH